MTKITQNLSSVGGRLDTLALSGTKNFDSGGYKTPIIVNGDGTDLVNNKALKGRAKRKIITQNMILSLIDVVKKKDPKAERIQSYWNAYHCQSKIFSHNGKLHGTYCKNRFCNLCCSIRKADIINRYLPVILNWEQPYFLTLTIKAVKANKLDFYIDGILKAFRQIKDKYKKKHQRGTGIKLIGVKSLECNFNPNKRTYNPHLHLILPNFDIAHTLHKEWVMKWTHKFASPSAQKNIRVFDKEKALIEIIKYGSKIFTEPDVDKKAKSKRKPKIYAAALDNILCALKDRQIFTRFGFNLPPQKELDILKTKVIKQYDKWVYDASATNWVNQDTGEILSDYCAPMDLLQLLNNNIDTDLN